MHEHIVVYPAAKAGPLSFPPNLAVADPLECLAYVAAVTCELLLGTAVLLSYRHPVVLAKRLATIDVLSRGRRSLLTVGLSTLPDEAVAAGVDFGTRGRRADEAIEVLRLLWGGTRPASASGASSSPSPEPAASPSRMAGVSCRSMSVARAWPLSGERAADATATSPVAG